MRDGLAALLLLGLPAWLATRRYRSYARAVPYPRKKSHSYGVRYLENLNLRESQAEGSALLLVVDYRSSFWGRFADPRLVVEVGGERHEFWLERGGRGTRYLVVPAPETSATVRVVGRHARVEAPVRRADAGEGGVPKGPLLVVAPHPDDAEIAAYGLMSDRPEDAHVVVVTTGDRGQRYATGVEREEGWTAWLRRFDALTVPRMAGVPASGIECLGLSEDDLANGVASDALPDLERRLVEIVARVRPAAVVVPHPVLESHPVHLACTLATLRALRRTGSRAEALFCLVHVPGARSYPLGPREAAVALPPWYDGESQFERLVVHRLPPIVQTEKLFALDAHHDLRPPPAPLRRPESLLSIARRRGREWMSGVEAVASRDYLRRAPAPTRCSWPSPPRGFPTTWSGWNDALPPERRCPGEVVATLDGTA